MRTQAINFEGLSPDWRFRLAAGLVVAWLLVMIVMFYFTRVQYESLWYSFDGSLLGNVAPASGSKTVIHFVDEGCPCTRFSKPHIASIEANFQDAGFSFRRMHPGESLPNLVVPAAVPASPAVAVWSERGELEYFGPYSSGALCGEGDDLLGAVLAGKLSKGQWTHQEAIGCFCPWTKT